MSNQTTVHQSRYPGVNLQQYCALAQDEGYQQQLATAGKITRTHASHVQDADHFEIEWDASVTSHLREPYLWPLRMAFGEIKSTWHEKHVVDVQAGGRGSLSVQLQAPFSASLVAQAVFRQEGDTLVREFTFNLQNVVLPGWMSCVPGAERIVVDKILSGLRHSDASTLQWLQAHPQGATPPLQDPADLAAAAALLQGLHEAD